MTSKDIFKGKRIAVIGLGEHGEMVEDVKFLIKSGAIVAIYDLKSEARLKNHLVFLRTVGLANYVCGSVPADDLLDMDLIIMSHEYPRDSSFLAGAKEKNIQIEYPETLFFKQAPPVTVVGIMGEYGKTSLMSLVLPILEIAAKTDETKDFFVIDQDSEMGILTHLKKIKNGDLVLMKIPGLLMKELCAMRISPQVAIFTTVPGRDAYEKSPFEILAFQTYNNYVIASDAVIDSAKNFKELPRAKMIRTKTNILPTDWNFEHLRPHDKENAALALQTAEIFKVDKEEVREILLDWKQPKGSLEFIKKVKNVEFYNDGASIHPDSTLRALEHLSANKNIILIIGGAENSNDLKALLASLPDKVHTLILLPGSGTIKERDKIAALEKLNIISAFSIEEAARLALENSQKGDTVLFSPAFPAGGMHGTRKERSERFVKAVRGL